MMEGMVQFIVDLDTGEVGEEVPQEPVAQKKRAPKKKTPEKKTGTSLLPIWFLAVALAAFFIGGAVGTALAQPEIDVLKQELDSRILYK